MAIGRYIKVKPVGDGYEVLTPYVYYSARYNRSVTVDAKMYSDGATMARDLENTDAWLVHDNLCRYGIWDDGSRISNWQASVVLSDILRRDGYTLEAVTWLVATFLFGGGAARKNGLWIVSNNVE